MPEPAPIRKPEEIRAWLDRHGVSITEWARCHGLKPAVVAALLSGRTRGNRGAAHEAAVRLGLRPAPVDGDEHPLMRFGLLEAQSREGGGP
jgi:gp16 family phage-associated protein